MRPDKKSAPNESTMEGIEVPPILLEGDTVSKPEVSGPGERFALGPASAAGRLPATAARRELPESYATGRLFLTVRDPHVLHAAWDFSAEQLERHSALSADGRLTIRVCANSLDETPLEETAVLPASRSRFLAVPRAETEYVAELGWRDREGRWNRIAASSVVRTPPDRVSPDTSARFGAVPLESRFEELLETLTTVAGEDVPFEEVVQQLRSHGHTELAPWPAEPEPLPWTAAQAQALEEAINMEAVRRVWMGSLEINEMISRHLREEAASLAAAQVPSPAAAPGPAEAVSSPLTAMAPSGGKEKPFWFNINAELVVYGATEPNAQVAIGGRLIQLRPDGTFSFRFALPDGKYDLPVLAVSADGGEARLAVLHFGRSTEYTGEVGIQAPDPHRESPTAPGETRR